MSAEPQPTAESMYQRVLRQKEATITAQASEIERLKAALKEISTDQWNANYTDSYILSENIRIAKEALEGK